MLVAIAFIAAYLLGSLPFGLLIARIVRGVDIRELGSRNVGATNVGRVLGLRWGLLVFLLDFCKGMLPVLAAQHGLPEEPLVALCAGAGAIVGHVFSLFLKGRGGKGVATSAGVLVLLAPLGFVIAVSCWAILLGLFRIMSVASLSAALALVVTQFLTDPDWRLNLFCAVLGLLVVWRHRSNLARLIRREEPALHAAPDSHQKLASGSLPFQASEDDATGPG